METVSPQTWWSLMTKITYHKTRYVNIISMYITFCVWAQCSSITRPSNNSSPSASSVHGPWTTSTLQSIHGLTKVAQRQRSRFFIPKLHNCFLVYISITSIKFHSYIRRCWTLSGSGRNPFTRPLWVIFPDGHSKTKGKSWCIRNFSRL
jgi:hypothetical protein